MKQYAFYFDSSACSGCKACQAACKDKHGLPVGVLWRRVYEVTGGGWTRQGEAWVSTVFAYNVSLACNHCERPICVEVCPAGAYTQRADGIVLLDADKCLGCQYCTWACPYGAPQYDEQAGHTSKCNFCSDRIDAGRPPACVAACPLRALDFGDREELQARYGKLQPVYPLPDATLTRPSFVMTPHREATGAGCVSNWEEIGTNANRDSSAPSARARNDNLAILLKEASLTAFTILSQLAVGTFWILAALSIWPGAYYGGKAVADEVIRPALPFLNLSMLLALLASFFHLGTPSKAWRALFNIRSSWLSREVLCAVLFAGAGFVCTGLQWFHWGAVWVQDASLWIAAGLGLALIICMAGVYRLRTVPAWNTVNTLLSFLLATLALGAATVGVMFSVTRPYNWFESDKTLDAIVEWMAVLTMVGVGLQLAFIFSERSRLVSGPEAAARALANVIHPHNLLLQLRLILAALGLVLAGGVFLLYGNWTGQSILMLLAFGSLLVSEILGRTLFYQARVRHGL